MIGQPLNSLVFSKVLVELGSRKPHPAWLPGASSMSVRLTHERAKGGRIYLRESTLAGQGRGDKERTEGYT